MLPLATAVPSPEAWLSQIRLTNGICALPGDSTCKLALKLARTSGLLLYVQLPGASETAAARQIAADAGLYGTRIYVEQGALNQLHLADHIADALLTGEQNGVPEAEALRVVRPGGKVLLGNKELTKPLLAGADDWSHPYHSPDNNPVSRDRVARGPYLTQFLAEPRYASQPQAAVASAGRVFKAFGHISYKEREEPWLNTLAAFNGYNGTLLWRQPITPGLMVHRNTLIATPACVYFADEKSCKVYDAATGELKDEIAPPASLTGGTFWKWMGLENGVLYALIGEDEWRDPVIRARSNAHGWPWNPLSPGYNQPEQPWGYGKTLVAIDPATKTVLWHYQEDQPMDGRMVCLKNGRIYACSFGNYLACLDAKTGKPLWRHTKESAPELFDTIGPYLNRQDWRSNFRTTALMRCSDQALYFAGPAISRLVAVSTADGRVLWSNPFSNYQLILRDDALYGFSGQVDKEISCKFDPLTGKVLGEIKLNRRGCARPTASCDAVFLRAGEGSTRLDVAKNTLQLLSPMRAQCHDGVTIANGLLYWWPSTCDCNLSLYGITCLGPAGAFNFDQPATDAERLEITQTDAANVAPFPTDNLDWPTFRADNLGLTRSAAPLRANAAKLWEFSTKAFVTPSAPTTAGDLAFFSGSDGIVRAVDTSKGRVAWTAFAGGNVRLPPTVWQGRALAGSGDGWVYAWEAKTGRPLWRFRAAPAERKIPVYGELLSTWPAASGVAIENGVAFVAAGLANYDGTHVYALDAATGRIKWQNNTSGHLDADGYTGVGVQGHLLLHDGKLFLAGGNALSPGTYDLATGKCLNELKTRGGKILGGGTNILGGFDPRGWELFLVANTVKVSGKPYYAHPQYPVVDPTVTNKTLYVPVEGGELAWINNAKLMCFANLGAQRQQFETNQWGKLRPQAIKPRWEQSFPDSRAVAVTPIAVLIATPAELTVLNLKDGSLLWKQPLPAAPVPWGLAITRNGKIIITLEGGRVLCFG